MMTEDIAMTGETVDTEEVWATLDEIRDDLQSRSDQLASLWERIQTLGREIDALAFQVAEVEDESRLRRHRRGRRRRGGAAPKGPTVVDEAVAILRERGGPMPCTELARAVRARGIDSGNNERSIRMSAGKGRRLRSLGDDTITLA